MRGCARAKKARCLPVRLERADCRLKHRSGSVVTYCSHPSYNFRRFLSILPTILLTLRTVNGKLAALNCPIPNFACVVWRPAHKSLCVSRRRPHTPKKWAFGSDCRRTSRSPQGISSSAFQTIVAIHPAPPSPVSHFQMGRVEWSRGQGTASDHTMSESRTFGRKVWISIRFTAFGLVDCH